MAPLTPIRVRGKRNAPEELKRRAGKQRKALRPGSATTSETGSSAISPPSAGEMSRRRRKKRTPELSQLEQLPTEILHAIFEYSANIDLPLASAQLASQLSNKHLQHSLTSIVLQPVLDRNENEPADGELKAAMRLMNSNFFTLQFFQSWLFDEFDRRDLLSSCLQYYGTDEDELQLSCREDWCWINVLPHRNLLRPLKLLRGPFTHDNTRFLQILSSRFRPHLERIDPVYIETARQGLPQAVSEGARSVLDVFWALGLKPDTELLRIAVIDSGCDKFMVRTLADRAIYSCPQPSDVDFLDPTLWSWAEKAEANGDDKGAFLKDILKSGARVACRDDGNIKGA